MSTGLYARGKARQNARVYPCSNGLKRIVDCGRPPVRLPIYLMRKLGRGLNILPFRTATLRRAMVGGSHSSAALILHASRTRPPTELLLSVPRRMLIASLVYRTAPPQSSAAYRSWAQSPRSWDQHNTGDF